MNNVTKALVLFVIVLHTAVFVVEAFLWMHPGIHEVVLTRLTSTPGLAAHDQALVLKNLFVNLGFYNLSLATAGAAGLVFLKRGNASVGYVLILYMCLSAGGAGVVLALSTRAYVGAVLQAVPAALAVAAVFRARSAERLRMNAR